MNWLFDLHKTQPIAHAIGALAFVCVLGMALGSLKFRGIGLGTAGVLFAGILVGHFGDPVDQHTLHFVKEFGLLLFVFTIGLQLGPGFFAALRNQGVKLNLLAAAIVILGAVSAPLIGALAGFDMAAVLGIYSGAVTNTPSLGAGFSDAQHAYRTSRRIVWLCPRSVTPLPTRWRLSASSEHCFCSSKSSALIP
jgi:putative transport protein